MGIFGWSSSTNTTEVTDSTKHLQEAEAELREGKEISPKSKYSKYTAGLDPYDSYGNRKDEIKAENLLGYISREDILLGLKKIEISILEDEVKIVNIFVNVTGIYSGWMHSIVQSERSVHDILDIYIGDPTRWSIGKHIIEEGL